MKRTKNRMVCYLTGLTLFCLALFPAASAKLGKPDESGRRRPVPVKGSNFRLKLDTIITAIGEQVDLGFVGADVPATGWSVSADPVRPDEAERHVRGRRLRHGSENRGRSHRHGPAGGAGD